MASANLFRPKDTGKQASSREMSATGVFTSGDPRNATAEAGGEEVRLLVEAAVKFIRAWRSLPR